MLSTRTCRSACPRDRGLDRTLPTAHSVHASPAAGGRWAVNATSNPRCPRLFIRRTEPSASRSLMPRATVPRPHPSLTASARSLTRTTPRLRLGSSCRASRSSCRSNAGRPRLTLGAGVMFMTHLSTEIARYSITRLAGSARPHRCPEPAASPARVRCGDGLSGDLGARVRRSR